MPWITGTANAATTTIAVLAVMTYTAITATAGTAARCDGSPSDTLLSSDQVKVAAFLRARPFS